MNRGLLLALKTIFVIALVGIFVVPAFSPAFSGTRTESVPMGREVVEQQEDGTFVLERDFTYSEPILTKNEYMDTWDIDIPECTRHHIQGSPWLPAESVSVALPPNMIPSTVEVEATTDSITIPLTKAITPSPEPVAVSDTYEEMYGDQSDPTKYYVKGEVYGIDEYYPESNIEYGLSFGLAPQGEPKRNDIRLTYEIRSQYVDIKLFPVQYNPVANELLFYPDLNLKLTYDENPDYAGAPATRAQLYDMVIITPRSFVNTFETLADYRNSTGVVTKVVAKEDVYAGYYFTSQGTDNPEKIKYFLKNAIESWGISYVCLAGDSGQIPIRFIRIDSGNFANTPSDLYYADVYGSGSTFVDWQVDNDAYWGEWTDDVSATDLRPDLHLGRLPCTSTTEASNMITKIQNYETLAYGSSWYNTITCMGTDTFSGGTPEGEYYSDYLCNNYYTTARGWTHNKLYASTGNCNSGTLLQTGNHHVGILTFSDHGLETGWAGKVSVNNINSFSNGDKLPIVSVDACLCGAFDVGTCFGEKFLKKSTGGGIGVLASSRISLGIVGSNHIHGVSGFYNRMFHYSNTDVASSKQTGTMYSGAQNLYYQYQSPKTSGSDYLVLTEYCFFGDPAVAIGGFSKTHGTISCDETEKSIDPGQEIFYNFNITNTGTGLAYVTFIVTLSDGNPIPPDWVWGLSNPEITLNPSETQVVIMNLTAPVDAQANQIMDISFKAVSPNIEESPLVINTNTTVNRVFNLDFTCTENEKTVEPGGAATYVFDIDNLGNDEFLYGLTVIDAPEDWTVQLSNSSITVPFGEHQSVQLYVKPDAKTVSSTYNYRLKCYFVDKPTVNLELFVTTHVSPSNGFHISPKDDPEKDALPGDVVEFDVDIENIGNHDDFVMVSFPNKNQLTGWLVKSLSGTNIDVEAFATRTITVEATVPNNALAGPVHIEIEGDLDSDSSTKLTTLTVDVEELYVFDMTVDQNLRTGSRGAQVPFNITMANSGNVKDTYDLSIENQPEDWTITLSDTMSLEAYSSDVTNMVVTLPDEDIKAGKYNITIEATSRSSGDSSIMYLTVDIPLSLGVDLVADVEQIEASPGEKVKFYITVKNTGNDVDTYKITRSSLSLWDISLSKEETQIDEFSEDRLVLDVSPPANAYLGQYSISIKGVSKTDGSIEDSLEILVYIKQSYDLELTSEATEEKIKNEGEVTFKYKLTNLGNGRDSYRMTFDGLPSGWDVEADSIVELNSGQTHNGIVTITIPEDKSSEKIY